MIRLEKKYVVVCSDGKEFKAVPGQTEEQLEADAVGHETELFRCGNLISEVFYEDDSMPKEITDEVFNWLIGKILDNDIKIVRILSEIPDIRIDFKKKK